MADQPATSSETPNQPASTSAADASATAAKPAPPAQNSPAPAADGVKPAEAAKPSEAAKPAAAAPVEPAKPAEAEPGKPAEPAAAAPAEIAYEIKAPQGVTIDPEFLPAFTPALKKAGVTNEQFQTLVESYLEIQKGIPQRMLARDLEVTAKDPVIGGMRYAQTLKEVNLALEAFGDPEFKSFVQAAGIANRLPFVRFVQRIGEAMAKAGDGPVRGSPDAAPPLTTAQKLYSKTAPK